jgi:hypothetical protein
MTPFFLLLVGIFFLFANPAQAQSTVTVIGPITAGDCAVFNSTTVLKDSGGTGCTGSGAGIPGGVNGSIQYNNSGNFGGYTLTQLTALLNVFTATLQGLVPASGGGTTNFLRADGTFAAPPGTGSSRAVVNVTSAPYNARSDFQFLSDGAVNTSAATTFTSATAGFSAGTAPSGSVGKKIDIAGAAAAGAVLHTTIAAYVNPTTVTLTAGASTTVSGATFDVGTDNTSAIASAISAGCIAGQVSNIYIPSGSYGVTSFQEPSNCTIFGDGWNVTVLEPMGAYSATTGHVVDRISAVNAKLRDFQISQFNSINTPATAIFDAQISTGVANANNIDNVYATGTYSAACYYNFSVPSMQTNIFKCYNYNAGSSAYVKVFTSSNSLSLSSAFGTPNAGGQAVGNIVEIAPEAHSFNGTDPGVIWLDGVAGYVASGGNTTGGATSYVKMTGANTNVVFDGAHVFETEGQTEPTNVFNLSSGSLNGFHCDQCSYVTTGNMFTGTGSLSGFKNGSQFEFMSGGSTIASNTTAYIGAFGFSTVGANAIGQLLPIAGTLSNLHVFSNTTPGGVQTYTILVYANGNLALTCTITGSAQSCTDSNHYGQSVAGAVLALVVATSASATAATLSGTVEFHPFQ